MELCRVLADQKNEVFTEFLTTLVRPSYFLIQKCFVVKYLNERSLDRTNMMCDICGIKPSATVQN